MSNSVHASQPPEQDPLRHYTRVFVKFLQLLFNTWDRGGGVPRWTDDPNTTEILITDQGQIGREVVEQRPAILVKRGTVQTGNVAIGQFAGMGPPSTGRVDYSDLMASSMQYRCIAKEGLEAQNIAYIAYMETRRFKKTLMRAGHIHRVAEDMTIGEETDPGSLVQPEGENELSMVPVYVPFYFRDSWSVEPLDKLLLKELDLVVTSQAEVLGPRLKPPMMNGEVLKVEKVFSLNSRVKVKPQTTPKPRK